MKKYQLYRETVLPLDIDQAWLFFSNPFNLQEITPKEMSFKIVSKNIPAQIYNGLKINYIVKPILGIPLKWFSQISAVNAPQTFVDVQLSGPYAYWHHEHRFLKQGDQTLMIDHITYCMPMGILGKIAHKLFVKAKLERIFNYRTEKISKLFKAENY